MKRLLSCAVALCLFFAANAQTWVQQSSTNNMYAVPPTTGTGNANVGIGTSTPAAKLQIVDNSTSSTLALNNSLNTARASVSFGPGNTSTSWSVGVRGSGWSAPNLANSFYIYNSATGSHPLIVKNDNRVIIGATNVSTSALLGVKGTIYCARLKVTPVTNTTDWPDYVFADDYNLISLDSVESYIKANKHLINIPSAQEVVDNGLDVADNQKMMLQKIEELTLYIIQQQKEIKELQQQIQLLKAK